MLNNTKNNGIRCVRCTSQNNTKLHFFRKRKLTGIKTTWAFTLKIVTKTYETLQYKVPICSDCSKSFSQWEKRSKLPVLLSQISFSALIVFIGLALYKAFVEPVIDDDPSTHIGLPFEYIFLVIITIISTIALYIIVRKLFSSESNLNNYIHVVENKVLITPSNSTRGWFLESWVQIVTEEQLEAEKLYIMANPFYEEGNYIEAIKLYDKALDLFPEYTDVIHDKNLAISKQRNLDKRKLLKSKKREALIGNTLEDKKKWVEIQYRMGMSFREIAAELGENMMTVRHYLDADLEKYKREPEK
ncbi:hypothetical protein LCGC14_2000210 [marine sediment metagenome]|uniref:Uncharacterized protein n=1 Tax=marine sediment metagenome TaxID=412755 RepID=A0A0F9FRB8_9ZZZZ